MPSYKSQDVLRLYDIFFFYDSNLKLIHCHEQEELSALSGGGKIQLQLWYRDVKNELILTVVSAHDLPHRTTGSNTRGPPEPYVVVTLETDPPNM